MFKIQYLSILTPGLWADALWLGAFSTEQRARNAANKLQGYSVRVVHA